MAERIARISELNSLEDYIKYDVNTNGLSIYRVKKVTSNSIAGLQFIDSSNNVLSDANYPMLSNVVKEPFIIDMSSLSGSLDSSLFRSNGISGATYTMTIYNSSYALQLLYIPNTYPTSELWSQYCLVYTESNGYNYIVPFKSVPYKQSNWNDTVGMLGYIKNKPNGLSYSKNYYAKQYLTIEAITSGTVTIKYDDIDGSAKTILYSTNNGNTWTSITTTSSAVSLKTLAIGEKILFKGSNTSYSYGLIFGGTAQTKVYGNIMSLIYGDNFINQNALSSTYTFKNLFYAYTNLISAENLILPVTTLTQNCYSGMFGNCTSLTKAPELPATTLGAYCYGSMFYNCTSLTEAPKILPATTLANGCYFNMFRDCTSLTKAPELPATTLVDSCYSGMFGNCTSLTKAPELPATTLAQGCYGSMFYNCTSLTEAPKILPATTLAQSCYGSMFGRCTSLTAAPELLATTLGAYCYGSMFEGCTSLTEAPKILLATTLANGCYFNMFRNCTSLTKAPELPATTLVNGCYQYMFDGCTNLNYIKALFTTTPSSTYTNNWVSGVAATGTFIKNDNATWTDVGINAMPDDWTIYYELDESLLPKYNKQCLTTEALESGIISFNIPVGIDSTTLSYICYSTNNGSTWTKINNSSSTVNINVRVKKGTKVLWKGSGTKTAAYGGGSYGFNYSYFSSTCKFNVYGNIMSLIHENDYMFKNTLSYGMQFAYLFYGESDHIAKIIDASNLILPATTLTESCYSSMFYGCTSLTKAPELLATTLATTCYYSMFYGCTSLTTAPELPATTLAQSCYSSMFYGCTSLTTAPELPATTLVIGCYDHMFTDCTSLTTAPELPATTLAQGCYGSMFYNCTSLTEAPKILPATTLAVNCYNSMFYGCTLLTKAPELPATSLDWSSCYSNMFYGCSNLNYIKANFSQFHVSPDTVLNNWVYGVSSIGEFVSNGGAESFTQYNSIPTGWYIKRANEIQHVNTTSLSAVPNVLYIFTNNITSSTTITFMSPLALSAQKTEYHFIFTSSYANIVTFNNTIYWKEALSISANTRYEITVIYDPRLDKLFGICKKLS